MSADNSTQSDSNVPHPSYTETARKSHNSQDDVAEAWAAGKYPTHNVGSDGAVLYTGSPEDDTWGRGPDVDGTRTNFYGVQHPDGSGHLWHYSTRECIRLQDGTIINNQQCWSSGFAHCSVPDDYDYTVPLDAIEEHLDGDDTVFDIADVWGQPEVREHTYSDDTYTVRWARNSIVVIDGSEERYGIYLGRDSSIINGNSHFSFRLSDDELLMIDEPEAALNLLEPDVVTQSDMGVIDSDDFVETKLSADELQAHEEAGGKVSRIERGGRYRDEDGVADDFQQASWSQDYLANRQQFRADLRGNVIVRHGEWFFIPEPDADPDEVGTRYAAEQLDSHRAQRHHGARSPLPTECPDCGGSDFEIETEDPRFGSEYEADFRCKACDTVAPREIYVHGQIRHTSNDHNAINLGDVWHRAVSHDRDVRTYDDNPVQGSRGGGWD